MNEQQQETEIPAISLVRESIRHHQRATGQQPTVVRVSPMVYVNFIVNTQTTSDPYGNTHPRYCGIPILQALNLSGYSAITHIP